jgi:mycothiol synthase
MIPQPIDFKTLTDEEALPLHNYFNALRAEELPEDPPIPFEERLTSWRNPSDKEWSRNFVVMNGEEVIGSGGAGWDSLDEQNPHMAWAGVSVAAAHRRRGIGRVLAKAVLEASRDAGKTKFFLGTNARVPAGDAFAAYFGAKKGIEEHTNQLLFSDLNREYVAESLREAASDKFELGWYDGEYPESELEAICRLYEVMNTAPRGDLEFNDWKVKPEDLLEDVKQAKINGVQWWLLYVKDRATGQYAGFTQTGFHPNRPDRMNQWGTAVVPEFRGHKLGAWLKSAMIDRILRDRPSVDRIRTGNADSNSWMLAINHALGFKPFISRTEWQLDIAAALEKLNARELVAD